MGAHVKFNDDAPYYFWRIGNPSYGLAFKTEDGVEVGRICFPDGPVMRVNEECRLP